MIRNFLSGIVIGGAVAGLGVVVISQITPLPGSVTEPVAEAANSADAPLSVAEPAKEGDLTVADAPQTEPAAATPEAAPEAEAVAEPAAMPTPSSESATQGDLPDVAGSVLASPGALPKPDIAADAPATPSAPTPGMAVPEVPLAGDLAPLAPEMAAKPSLPAAEPAPVTADLPPAAPAEANEVLLTPPVLAPAAEMAVDQPVAEPATQADAADGAVPAPEMIVENEPAVQDSAPAAPAPPPAAEQPVVLPPSATPAVLAPAPGLSKTVDGVTTGRLPSIGAADVAPTVQTPAELQPDDPRPLVKFARAFTDDSGKPAFAVVLIDTGAADLDRAQLAALPFPVSFVIDPLDPTAAEAAAIYRAGGQEVVMLASGIPRGANAADLEQTFQSNEIVLPEAVAVMDIGDGGFQDNRPLAGQVVPLIKEQGRGLLTFDRGLNAADQVARRDGVPSAVIFRELDTGEESAPLIRRYLDRAAFKAAQEGRVVVLGSTRPETIQALMEWAVEGRSASVSLAPLTAVLTKP